MANQPNAEKNICELLDSENERLKKLQENIAKLKYECYLYYEEKLKLTAENFELEESIMKAELNKNTLEMVLQRKQAEDEQLAEAILKHQESIHKLRLQFNVPDFINRVKEFLDNIDSIEKDYEAKNIEADIKEHHLKLEKLSGELKAADEYFKMLVAEDIPEESLQLEEVLTDLENQLKRKKELEMQLEDVLEKLKED